MTLYQVNNNEPATSYKIEGKDFSLESIAVKRTEVLISKEAGVDVYVTAPSAVGPRGRAFTYEDFTPEQLEGLTGPAGTIEVGSVTTGQPGSSASIVNVGTDEHAILDFTIPEGVQGEQGEKGNDGQAATIRVGSVTTGQPGTNASVTNVGTSSDAIFNFTIPRGNNGERGQTGPQGLSGKDGQDGRSASVRVGTVTTLPAGSQATVVNTGTEYDAVFSFGIPRGNDGSTGPAGVVQDVQTSTDGVNWTSALVGNVAKVLITGGGGGTVVDAPIQAIQKNGTTLPIVNKTVNVTVPTAVSQLTQDVSYALSSSLANVATSGSYTDLTNKPTIPSVGAITESYIRSLFN